MLLVMCSCGVYIYISSCIVVERKLENGMPLYIALHLTKVSNENMRKTLEKKHFLTCCIVVYFVANRNLFYVESSTAVKCT